MSTLLIRLSGPLQSWGGPARFNLRPTQQTPTKSGVIGLVCAAMGIPRSDSQTLAQLNQLKFGVRVDRPGQLLIDYHTVSGAVNAAGVVPQETTPTDRYYLAGAVFLAGLEGDDRTMLENIHSALLKPHWLLCLGRKSCMLGEPVWLKKEDSLVETDLETALRQYPPLRQNSTPIFLELEDPDEGSPRMDNPLHFGTRQYAPRLIRTSSIAEEK